MRYRIRLIGILLTMSLAFTSIYPIEAMAKTVAEKEKNTDESDISTVTISAAGDCTLGVDSRYNNNFNNYYSKNNSKYFLKKVKGIFEQDDITIVNLEGTLTTSTNRAKKTFTFKGAKKYTSILKNGSVEVVNLANNHTMDFGEKGFKDTKEALNKAQIKYAYNTTIAYKKVNGVKVAFLGFNELAGVTKADINKGIKAAQDKGATIIITSFHWGIERDYYPNNKQKELAHYAIDQGASLVIGHHPHVLQGIEQYKDRYILYSLGNFCFGGNSNPSDKDTMIFQQTFYIHNGELSTKKDARVIPCSLSGSTSTNDFQPRILKGIEKKRVIGRLNKFSGKMKVSIKPDGTIKEKKSKK